MNEYLVESHLGGYYISSMDPEIIEDTCQQCFDSDRILASWPKDNKEERIENISNYLCWEDINEETYSYYLEYAELDTLIDIEEDLHDTFSRLCDIVYELQDYNYIDEASAITICDNIMSKHKKFLEFAKNHSVQKTLKK